MEQKDIVFSLPVHEKLDVIFNQLENIKFFCGHYNYAVVIHISRQFTLTEQEIALLKKHENVVINPQRLLTGWLNGCLLRIHVENCKYAIKNYQFKHLVFLASNIMFIKKLPVLTGNAGPFFMFDTTTGWYQGIKALRDKKLDKTLRKCDKKIHAGNQIDGMYFSRDNLIRLTDAIDKCYPKYRFTYKLPAFIYKHLIINAVGAGYRLLAKSGFSTSRFYLLLWGTKNYATEEIYYATLYFSMELNDATIQYPFTNGMADAPAASDYTRICYMGWTGVNGRKALVLDEVPDDYCAVKPVARNITNPLRVKITEMGRGSITHNATINAG